MRFYGLCKKMSALNNLRKKATSLTLREDEHKEKDGNVTE